jgi:hypothetical protein
LGEAVVQVLMVVPLLPVSGLAPEKSHCSTTAAKAPNADSHTIGRDKMIDRFILISLHTLFLTTSLCRLMD